MDFLIGASTGLAFSLSLYIYSVFPKGIIRASLIIILLGTVGFSVGPSLSGIYGWVMFTLQSLTIPAFWILCQYLFAVRPMVFSIWGGAALLVILLAQLDFSMQFYSYDKSDVLKNFIYLMEYSIILHSFYVVLRNWESDLIEPSRKLRKTVFASFAIGICIGAVGLNTGIMIEAYRPIVVIVGVLLVGKALYGFRYDELDHLVGQTAGSPKTNPDPDTEDHAQIEFDSETKLVVSVMESGFYRELDATIGSLASRSGFPEYKVRRIISQELGYRNFNGYLNRLRTKSAADRLMTEPETPIKVIAYDVGYRSVTSFNRAFKEAYGVSPSTYRTVS